MSKRFHPFLVFDLTVKYHPTFENYCQGMTENGFDIRDFLKFYYS